MLSATMLISADLIQSPWNLAPEDILNFQEQDRNDQPNTNYHLKIHSTKIVLHFNVPNFDTIDHHSCSHITIINHLTQSPVTVTN